MNNDNRPNPEDLLIAIKREERARNRGQLKIFLGMAAGVGKTYAMLEEARVLHKDNVNVVVGIVDTHGRQDTAALLKGLNSIPPKTIFYRDKEFQELDLDEIIKVHPQVVLVDELAHSNIPGSRHSKRWEDVIEILENGIDVYTTLNVQHIESLNDVVEGITGISVRETVPDSIVETANFIQLVDITPDGLLQRLKEGKVYIGDQSRIAANNFFQKDRLTALREIVLRFTAEKVDHDLHGLVSSTERVNGWRAREKLLVAVSASPHSQKLIRTTRRLAFHLDARWIALYINTGKILSEEENNQLAKNLSLARDLGAEVITTNDPDIADGIQRVATQRSVTQIIIGRPLEKTFFNFFRGPSLLDKLSVECSSIDVHVIRQERQLSHYRKKLMVFSGKKNFLPYFQAALIVLGLSGLAWLALPYIGFKLCGIIFFVGILAMGLYFSKGPLLFAAILFTLVFDYFFTEPTGDFKFYNYEHNAFLGLIIYVLSALVMGVLVDRARGYKEMLALREESALALYDILREIISAPSQDTMLKSLKERLEKIIDGNFEIVIKRPDGSLMTNNSFLLPDEKEKSVATWVFDNGKEAGWSTTTLPSSKNLYLPLKGYHEVVGVLIYRPKMNRILTNEQKNFLYTVGQQLAIYLEKTFTEEKARETEHMQHVEKIYHTVLKSISNEFQHPLASMQEAIFEAVQMLRHDQEIKPRKGVIPQIHKIERTSTGLSSMLDNVSVMAKLSGNLIPLNKELNNIEDIIKMSYEKMKEYLGQRTVTINIEEKLPLIPCDSSLIEIVLHNLIRNAIDNSPQQSVITINARKVDGVVQISVLDEGKGIPPDQINAIFDEFYRSPDATAPGMGLGLTIAKRIAEIHDGYVTAENLPEHGAKFSLFLPV